jgi:hypothetical protein
LAVEDAGEPEVIEEPEVATAAVPIPATAAHTPPAIAIFFHMVAAPGLEGT